MAGYTRQSVADIIASAVIKAGPVNAEYNAIRDAFAFATGHKHDGSSTEGAYVPLIADTDALNKVVVDTSNNRISVYTEVGGSAVEQLRIQDGAIVPVTDDDIDLGAAGAEFKDLYIDGIGYIDSVVITGGTIDGTVIGGTTPAAITGTTITGTSLVGPVTGDISGDVTGNLTGNVTGNVTGDLTGDVTSVGTSTFTTVDINGGNIDGTIIGATTPAAADFTTMDASGNSTVGGTFNVTGNTTLGGTLGVTGTSAFTGAISAGSLTTTGNSTHATVDINGGAIDGTTIGATSASSGSFTTVSTSGQATLATVNIDGGTIDGTVIGGTSAQAITGTTITANTGFTGALTGNVTGNVTGNLTGDVTGDLTGDVTGNVTASTGTTTLNDLVVNGTVDFTSTALLNVSDPTTAQQAATKNYVDTNDALKLNLSGGTMSGDITMGGNTVTGLGTPSATSDAATKGYVDTEVAALVDSAPGTLDTLNELAAALGDDPDFATTITTSIATKLPLAGGTMTGDITMGANAVTSTATPATDDTLTRKGYVDTQDALKLGLTGGTMSGAIAMGTSKITGLGDPTAAQDAATKTYVDTQDATKLNLSGGTMTGAIDMGANKITTTYTPTDAADLTTKTYVDGILGSATAAAASAAAAATSESNAATSETNAATSAANAAASYDDFDDRYLGAKSSAPTVDNDGDALVTGALYWDTTSNELYIWDGSSWQQGSFTAGSLLASVVEDTTPQLGGNLDTNGNDITFGDNDKAIFGAGSDLQIYHDGLNNYIDAANVGNLILQSQETDRDIILRSDDGSGGLADYVTIDGSTGQVKLRHYSDLKLNTLSTGVNITGTLTSDGLTVDGTFNFTSAVNGIINNPASFFINIDSDNNNAGEAFYISRDAENTAGARVAKFDATGDISFYEDTGTTAKFFWDASAEGLAIGDGGSGIEGMLDLQKTDNTVYTSSSRGNGFLQITNASTTSGVFSGIEFIATGTGSAGAAEILCIDTGSGSGDLAFTTRNGGTWSEKMRIDSSGNVGIGTDSPASVGVAGMPALSLMSTTSGRSGGLYWQDTGGTTVANSYFFGSVFNLGTSTSHPFAFKTDDTERMRIASSGRVAIGASSFPVSSSAMLTLSTNQATTGIQLHGASGNGGLFIKGGGGEGIFYTYTQALGSESYAERMRIDSSGNVGIGTSSPAQKLDVNGSINIPNDYSYGFGGSGSNTYISGNNASNNLRFNTNGSERMRINSSGRVGIGTSSPDSVLHIASENNGTNTFTMESLDVFLSSAQEANAIHFQTNDGSATGVTGKISHISENGNEKLALAFSTYSSGLSEAMRIDSSGNLLVGTTTFNSNNVGVLAGASGAFFATRDGNTPAQFNRKTSDGSIVGFQKDGTTVGSIGTNGGQIYAGSSDVGVRFRYGSTDAIEPFNPSSEALRDNAIDLGLSSNRFKDAHFSGTVNAANFNTTSDATLKTNVETLSGSLDAVMSMRGVSFDWIESGNSEVGVIAQEVEEVLPELVNTNDEGIKSVKYGNLVGVLIEAIKEQQAQIDELKARLGD